MQSSEDNFKRYSIYVNAHQDDWQFFRGEVAWADVSDPSNKILFIYTTAGDGGLETLGKWESRERGAMASIRSMLPKKPVSSEIISCNGHPIVRYSCENTRSYFMRLPDGNMNGDGFKATNNTSLKKLYDNNVPITAVDKSTTYNNQQNFLMTLIHIIMLETPSHLEEIEPPWINVSDYDLDLNPRDHSDHHYTSLTVYNIANLPLGKIRYRSALYVTYASEHKAPNLDGIPLTHKRNVFDAYKKAAVEEMALNGEDGDQLSKNYEAEWKLWGNRSYCRTKP